MHVVCICCLAIDLCVAYLAIHMQTVPHGVAGGSAAAVTPFCLPLQGTASRGSALVTTRRPDLGVCSLGMQ